MQQDQPTRKSILLVILETGVALLLAFFASILLGGLAFVATAALVEEDGVMALMGTGRKMSVALSATDPEKTPSLADTTELVQQALPGADVIVVPDGSDSKVLMAWLTADLPNNALGTIVGELQRLGWERPEPSVVVQPGLMGAMENPRRMRVYIPSLMSLQALCFVAATWILLRWRKPAALGPKRGLKAVAAWGAGAAVVAFLFSSLIGGLLRLLGLEIEEQGWIQALMADRDALLGLAPWLVLIGPISEEVFFRGYVFRRVHAAAGPGLGYAVSAVLFGFIHLHPVGFPMYTAIGLVFCWVHRRTGTLWAPVIAHVLYNGIVLSIPFILSAPT